MSHKMVVKEFSFCYGHHLPGYAGKCVRPHGHNSRLLVGFEQRFTGSMYEPPAGMIVDFTDIKAVIDPILEELDHHDLNEFMEMPTAENMVEWLKNKISCTVLGPHLCMIQLYETPTSYVEWRK